MKPRIDRGRPLRYHFHPNGLGSTTFVTDQTGATIQKTIYYPWGQAWASAGTVKDNRFASMDPRDAETGNDPTLFRLYNPRLYRWLSPDPLAGDVMNPQSLNRYAYVLNNPTNLIDPLGLDCTDLLMSIESPDGCMPSGASSADRRICGLRLFSWVGADISLRADQMRVLRLQQGSIRAG